MSAVLRSVERLAASTDGSTAGDNQRRVDEAFRLLGLVAVRIATNPNPAVFVLDLASRNGQLQDVWCREADSVVPADGPPFLDAGAVSAALFGPVNAERFVRAQKALSALVLELARPNYTGSATIRIRGAGGEIADEIRGESRRLWPF